MLSLVYLVLKRMWDIARGATFEPRSVIAGLVIGPLAAIALVAAYELGAFDTLTNRLFDDEGSAGTRIEMFELFRYLSVYDLVFGPDPSVLMTWVRLHGLEYGIESFVIAFVLLRLAHDANRIVKSPLAFARLIRANLMHRRSIAELLQRSPPPDSGPPQTMFDFGATATRAAQRRRASRACAAMQRAA